MRTRGVLLDSLEVLIRARASVRTWGQFVKTTGLSALPGTGEAGGKADYAAYFYALPTASESALYLYGALRPAPDDKANAHLQLRWELIPEGRVPQRIKRSSTEVGGYPEVLARIATRWPDQKSVSIDVTATFVLDKAVYAPHRVLRFKETRPSVRGHQLTQTAAAWRVDPPSGPVHRLSVAPIRTNELVLVASGHHTSTLGPDIEAELEGAVWAGIETFLAAS